MTRIVSSTASLAILLVVGLHAAPTQAQSQLARTYVSSLGSDTNDCNRLTPCRTFAVAHGKTLGKGEITVLDPGGYGAVTITKAISIINDGVGEAGILVSGGFTGITVNAGAGDAVSLRGITIKGIGFGGGDGIHFNSGKSLTIENCAIRTLDGIGTGFGVLFNPAPIAGATSSLTVSNTIVSDTTSSGIVVNPGGAGIVTAQFNRVEVFNTGSSAFVVVGSSSTGLVRAVAFQSVAASNDNHGFIAQSAAGKAPTRFMIVNSVSASNDIGVSVGTNAIARIGQSHIFANSTAWAANGGQVISFGDNHIIDNGQEFAPPTVSLQ